MHLAVVQLASSGRFVVPWSRSTAMIRDVAVIALLLALGSSLAYGCADFLGGLGARKAHVLRTVMIAAPASLTVELLLWPFLGASFSAQTLAWGAASGVASAAAFALLYRTLA